MKELVIELRVIGGWVAGKGRPATLVNPATEEALATARPTGIDFGAALAFARDRGGPALRAMTFASAASCSARCRKRHPRAPRRAASPSPSPTAATRAPTRSSTSTAPRARSRPTPTSRPELGDARSSSTATRRSSAERAPLRSARLRAASRRGGARQRVQLPRVGPRREGGVRAPRRHARRRKPATSTALVAHRIVEILVEEKVLPPGRSRSSAARAGDCSIGSAGRTCSPSRARASPAGPSRRQGVHARTRSRQRRGRQPERRRARARREDGSDLVNLFVGDVARDMTQKTGQKCTAIRRVYVPAGRSTRCWSSCASASPR
jgi:3,4-dehydroadipyl-CoA semialdehyde dehydrogenase